MCLVNKCGLFETYVDRYTKCFQKFYKVFRITLEWVPAFPARIFISPISVMPIFKSFSLQLFFREILNDQSAGKKTVTTTFPNNLKVSVLRYLVADSGGEMTGLISHLLRQYQQKMFVLKVSGDLRVRTSKTQWLTSS